MKIILAFALLLLAVPGCTTPTMTEVRRVGLEITDIQERIAKANDLGQDTQRLEEMLVLKIDEYKRLLAIAEKEFEKNQEMRAGIFSGILSALVIGVGLLKKVAGGVG